MKLDIFIFLVLVLPLDGWGWHYVTRKRDPGLGTADLVALAISTSGVIIGAAVLGWRPA